MSAWRKVFLRNGLIWTPYILVWPLLAGEFSGPGWPLGFSDSVDQWLTLLVFLPVWAVMCGGGMCLFRRMVPWVKAEAAEKRRALPTMRWRWFWSYFLEIDEEYRLRP
jgi:hypothetical protein